ncbi:MAG: hypothetical protein IH789_13715, partial [Acidobacteria bacterium]|nr:hypothetical protein [Acidobacteriota bacterium]
MHHRRRDQRDSAPVDCPAVVGKRRGQVLKKAAGVGPASLAEGVREGDARAIAYRSDVDGAEHVALVKGDISGPEPVLVRMHAVNILDDVLHDQTAGREGEIESALRAVGEAGRGVVVLIRDTWAQRFSNQVRQRHELPMDPNLAS